MQGCIVYTVYFLGFSRFLNLAGFVYEDPTFSHGHRRRRAVSFTLTESGRDDAGTLSEKSARAGHRAMILHRDCVLVSH